MAFKKLYEYQERMLKDMPSRQIFFFDTGTGKTAMSIVHYIRNSYPAKLLILAPASKARTGDWDVELAEIFQAHNLPLPTYEIYSYEKWSRDPSLVQFRDGKRALWKRFVPSQGGEQWAIICDEVHKAKNPQSGIGKRVFQATQNADFFVGLSATPLPNGWIDFANYSKIWGFTKHITDFKKKFCNIQDYKGFPEIVNYWHEDTLKKQWASISKKLTKAEANDLPSRTFIGVDFNRPAAYVKTILDRKDADGNLLDTAPALAHALRQTLTKPKLGYLEDLLDGTTENIVVFYNYITEREAILDLLNKKKFKEKTLFRQDGQKHQLPKKEDWSGVENSITLAQYQSGSTGVEMTYATQVVYFSPTYSYANYVQSIGRVYRNGQTKKTTFYNFRTPKTIEEDVYEILRTKNDFQATQWIKKIKE